MPHVPHGFEICVSDHWQLLIPDGGTLPVTYDGWLVGRPYRGGTRYSGLNRRPIPPGGSLARNSRSEGKRLARSFNQSV